MDPIRVSQRNKLAPDYIRPSNLNYNTYFDFTKIYNAQLQSNIKEFLTPLVVEYSNSLCLATTGSDGRGEKGPESQVELMFLRKNSDKKIDDVLINIETEIHKNNNKSIFDGTEIKNLETDLVCCYQSDTKRIFPTRVIDLVYFAGDKSLYNNTYEKLFSEVNSDFGKKIFEALKERKRYARKISETGIASFRQQKIAHFDLDEEIAYYNPEKFQNSFKQGPLRLAQYGIALHMLRNLQGKNANFFDEVPNNIPDRILYLAGNKVGNLDIKLVSDFIDGYKFFLHQFHISQDAYKFDRRKKTNFDKIEVSKRLKEFNELNKRLLQ